MCVGWAIISQLAALHNCFLVLPHSLKLSLKLFGLSFSFQICSASAAFRPRFANQNCTGNRKSGRPITHNFGRMRKLPSVGEQAQFGRQSTIFL